MSAAVPLRRWKLAAAAVLGAAATAPFSFEVPSLAPLVPLALAALLALAAPQRPRHALLLGWLFGLGFFGASVYWVFISTHIYGGAPWWLGLLMALSLFAYLALYPAVFLGVVVRMNWLQRPLGWVALPATWMLTELLRGWIWSGFPWLTFGYASVDTALDKFAPLIGVTGISGLLALAALAVFRLATAARPQRIGALGLLGALALASWLLPPPAQWTQETGAPLLAAIVQGNISQDEKWQPRMQLPTLTRYRDMTLAASDADIVVWPEVALTQRFAQAREPFLEPLAAELAPHGGVLMTGIVVEDDAQQGFYNSVVALGATSGRYDKRHLVPFGEFFPIPDFLKPLMQVLGTPYADFLFGAAQQAPITVKGRRIGVSICFEDAFGNEIRRDAADASFLVDVTNDAWFGRSPAARQHLQIARMRALENGRAIVRAANTGISALIGADGSLIARSGHFTTEVLRASVQPRSGVTPYARWGDAPLWWGSAGVVLLGLLPGLRRPEKKSR